jgi:spore coat polysaccharide biosynthesis predicted glycosyltransferase SpsG
VLGESAILAEDPDWVIVDSYRIPAWQISDLNDRVPVLAIVDGDHRKIAANLYLDQNLGAEAEERPPAVADRFLSGARFALIRNSVLSQRRIDPWSLASSPAKVLAFAGGTDPTGASVGIVAALQMLPVKVDLTVVAPPELHAALSDRPRRHNMTVLSTTPDLPRLFGDADIIITGAGTSAWEVCTLGIPSVMLGVVENQRESLAQVVVGRLALGLDLTGEGSSRISECGEMVADLLRNTELRRELSENCLAVFDGMGKNRVVDRMETGMSSPEEKM